MSSFCKDSSERVVNDRARCLLTRDVILHSTSELLVKIRGINDLLCSSFLRTKLAMPSLTDLETLVRALASYQICSSLPWRMNSLMMLFIFVCQNNETWRLYIPVSLDSLSSLLITEASNKKGDIYGEFLSVKRFTIHITCWCVLARTFSGYGHLSFRSLPPAAFMKSAVGVSLLVIGFLVY